MERVWDGRGRFLSSGVGSTIGVDWAYDAADRREIGLRRHQNLNHSVLDYDANDQLEMLSHFTGQTPPAGPAEPTTWIGYGYDPEGNRQWKLDFINEYHSEYYGHDNRGRLRAMDRGILWTNQIGDHIDHPTLASHQQWVDLDRRGNWLDYREQNKVGGILKPRRETRERNGVNQNVFVDADDPVTPPNPDTTVGNLAVKYDFVGNVTFDPLARLAGVAPDLGSEFAFGPGLEFAYDLENRVTSIHRDTNNGQSNVNDPTGEPKVMAFAYDALGRRVETTEYVDAATGELMDGASGHANPRKTRHVYFGLETIQEYSCGADGTSANLPNEWPCSTSMPLVREFIWGDPERYPEVVAMIRHNPDTQDEFPYHYLHDILGSVIGLVAGDGTLVARYTYDPYGKPFIEKLYGAEWEPVAEVTSGLPWLPFDNPFLFTGHRYDAAVGLCHTLFRTYSPILGRWLQRDPIGYEGGSINLYDYVLSDPLFWIDPFGLEPDELDQQLAVAGKGSLALASVAASGGGANGVAPDHEFAERLIEIGSRVACDGSLAGPCYLIEKLDEQSRIPGIMQNGRTPKFLGKLVSEGAKKQFRRFAKLVDDSLGIKKKKACTKKTSQIDRNAFKKEREAYWKAEAKNRPSRYSKKDFERMKKGRAPIGRDGFPKELHHKDQTPKGGTKPMTRTDHRLGKNYKKNHPK